MFRRVISALVTAILLAGSAFAANSPNIILITLEGIRADRVGFLGSKTATPNLDPLAKESLIFDRAYAQAPLTIVSHATILSGTYPQTHGASELGDPLSGSVPYLPAILRSKGYRTAAFVSTHDLDPRSGYASGFVRGFDTYDAGPPAAPADTSCHPDQTVARAAKWLSSSAHRPAFVWIHLCSWQTNQAATYDRGVSAIDGVFGRLITALRDAKLLEPAVIAVAADHGESLGAHGEDLNGIFLYDETIHVPLLIKLPQNQMAAKHVKGRVRLLDVAPTVLEAAGIPVPSQMQGQSLLRIAKSNPDADQAVYSGSDFSQQAFGWSPLQSWRASKYLYIRAPKPELYDVAADPAETRNLAQSSKATVDTIAAQLNSFDSHFGKSATTADAGLTSSEVQKLASLGYVGLQKSSATSAAVSGTDAKDTIAIANQTLKALLDLDAGKLDRAIPALQQVIKAQPTAFLAQYGLGAALVKEQKYSDAIQYLHKAIELQPKSPWANYAMAVALAKTKGFKTAAVHAEIAAARMPQFAATHSLLAQIYEQLGRKQDAASERVKAGKPGS